MRTSVFCRKSSICVLMLLMLSACDASPSESFQCDLHAVADEMPGLAAFRGARGPGGIDASLSLYREAMADRRIAEAEAYFCKAEILLSANRQHEALAMYGESIASNDALHEHFLARAELLAMLGDCSGALADFEAVSSNGGAGFGVDLARAQVLVHCGYPDEALNVLDSSSALIPGQTRPVNWVFTRVQALVAQERYEEALPHAEDVVRRINELGTCLPVMSRCINPRLIEAVDLNTEILCRMGMPEEAMVIYERHEKYQQPRASPPFCLEPPKEDP